LPTARTPLTSVVLTHCPASDASDTSPVRVHCGQS